MDVLRLVAVIFWGLRKPGAEFTCRNFLVGFEIYFCRGQVLEDLGASKVGLGGADEGSGFWICGKLLGRGVLSSRQPQRSTSCTP